MTLLPWDAHAYDLYALPHERWGRETIQRLELSGSETVLDFGCGTGRDTEILLDALPSGRVVAVDGSPDMLARLRERLDGRLHRVDVIRADLRQHLPVAPVDAVMSVATLHWLPDHDQIFKNIATILRPGGRFAAEAGGTGNIAAVLAAIHRAGRIVNGAVTTGADSRRNFVGVDETVTRLARAGFVETHVELVYEPMQVSADIFEDLLATVMLVPELAYVDRVQRPAFVRAVAREIGAPMIDWVRIRITARRS